MIITMLDGKSVFLEDCPTTKQIVDVVSPYCGEDFARVLEDILDDCDEVRAYAERRAETDCDSFEAELENYANVMNEVLEIIYQIHKQSQMGKRLYVANLLKSLDNIEGMLTAIL